MSAALDADWRILTTEQGAENMAKQYETFAQWAARTQRETGKAVQQDRNCPRCRYCASLVSA